MTPVTADDRRRELERLTAQIRQHPNRDWSEERHRIGVLATQLAAAGRAMHD
jgi:hypothetical protein